MHKSSWLRVIAICSTCLLGAATLLPMPATRGDDIVETIHGTIVHDSYHWLENASDPNVGAWTDAQYRRTRTYFDSLSYRKAVTDELTRLANTTSDTYSFAKARGPHVFAFCRDPSKQQRLLVAFDASADPSSRKTVFDPNALDVSGRTAIDWYVPSPDGRRIALSVSQNGTEDGTLRVIDASTGADIEAPIPRVSYPTALGSLAWTADSKAFWYTRYPGPEAPAADRHFNIQVYFHRLGGDARSDAIALGKKDGLERISEVYLDNRFGQRAVMAMVQRGDGNAWSYFILGEGNRPIEIATYSDKIIYATIGPDGAVYGISRNGASNGRIVKLDAPFVAGGLAHAPTIVPERDLAVNSGGAEFFRPDLNFSNDSLFVRYIAGGPHEVDVFALDGKPLGLLPLPELAANSEIEPLANGNVLFDVTTFLKPRSYMLWNRKSGLPPTARIEIKAPISFDDVNVARDFATSRDGTKIPLILVSRKGIISDGKNPTLLFGYGGFGLSQSPVFLGAHPFLGEIPRVWLDAGGIFAIANIRGGGEYGDRWHQEGMLTKKQNSFDDFVAAAHTLVDRHYTNSAKLAFAGTSFGGIVMGAAITQHPDLARAVISHAGVYDMIRMESGPNGEFLSAEIGDLRNRAEFAALYAYSPYHHVVRHTPYPAVLLMSGAQDGRADPMQSRKFAAALQAASSSGRPIFLSISKMAGHGFDTGLSERISEHADMLVFLFDQLGMKPSMGAAHDRSR